MAKFDYMEFGYNAGSFDMVVVHAKKFTEEEAIEIYNIEYAGQIGEKATTEDITGGYVKWYINPPDNMSSDFEGGCYGFVDKPGNGAFPVWVITPSELGAKS